MSEPILIERRGHIALLTLNRPDTRNALSGEAMFAAFEDLFASLNADMSVRVAILTGAGTSFCSGGNVAEMRERTGMFAGSPEEIAQRYREGWQATPTTDPHNQYLYLWAEAGVAGLLALAEAHGAKVLWSASVGGGAPMVETTATAASSARSSMLTRCRSSWIASALAPAGRAASLLRSESSALASTSSAAR